MHQAKAEEFIFKVGDIGPDTAAKTSDMRLFSIMTGVGLII